MVFKRRLMASPIILTLHHLQSAIKLRKACFAHKRANSMKLEKLLKILGTKCQKPFLALWDLHLTHLFGILSLLRI